MKVTLVSINCNDRHYGLGSYVLAAMVRQHVPEVKVRVCNYPAQQTNRSILFDLASEPAGVYGISVHHGHGPKALALAHDLKRIQPGAKIILGGTDAIALEPRAVEGLADLVVIGEGEWALVKALRSLAAGETPSGIPNLFRPEELADAAERPQAQHERLDDFPSPYLDGAFQEYERYPTVYLETYRGCVWNCSFCYEGRGRKRTSTYSDDRIREELRYLLETRRVPQLEFYDTIFNVEGERTRRLLEFLIRHNRGTKFIGEFMLEWLDQETIDLLGRANFSMIEAGLQSVNRQTLARSGRKVDFDRFHRNAESVLDRTDVALCIDAMYGLEGESLADFFATVDHIGGIAGKSGRRPTPILFATHVHPGTRQYQRHAAELVLAGERGGALLSSATVALGDTRRFYEIFYGYLFLRSTLPRTMNEFTGIVQRRAGVSLSGIYAEAAVLLQQFPASRAVFEQADWTEFRSNPFLRFFLDSVDRRYVLALAERLGAGAEASAEIESLLSREE